MPISRKDFMKGNFERGRYLMNEHPVLLYLKKNKKKAWTCLDIAKALNKKKDSVIQTLRTLKKQKKVLHKTPFWAAI